MSLILENLQVRLKQQWLFDPVSVTVTPGSIATVMGPSGCGKSTLLAAICGNLDPGFCLSGTVSLDGRELNHVPMEKRKVGILFQDDLLFPHLDVFGNLAFGLSAVDDREARIRSALANADLEGFEHRDIATLSGGQRARVSLLRTLLSEPRAILLDEPFSKLDQQLRQNVREFVFSAVLKLNIPALLVTHDANDAADGPLLMLGNGGTDA